METKNYLQWLIHITSILQTYSVMEIIDGSVTFSSLAIASTAQIPIQPENDEQKKWKLLDAHLCGFIAVILNDNLQLHVHFDWIDVTCLFVSVLWDKIFSMFGTLGLLGKFNLFHKVTHANFHTKHAAEDLNNLLYIFEQITKAGLNLPESFKAMFILTCLPNGFFTMASTLVFIAAEANFTVSLVVQHIVKHWRICRLKDSIPLTDLVSWWRAFWEGWSNWRCHNWLWLSIAKE